MASKSPLEIVGFIRIVRSWFPGIENNVEFDLNKHETESLIPKLKEELEIDKSRSRAYTGGGKGGSAPI